jgi:hypothetical protein
MEVARYTILFYVGSITPTINGRSVCKERVHF